MTLPDVGRTEITRIIYEWVIGRDAERDREIMVYRLIDGLTYEQIAARYQDTHPERPISTDTVKRVIHRRENQIFKHFPG